MAVADANPALRPEWLSGSRPAQPTRSPGLSRRAFWLAGAGAAGLLATAGGLYFAFGPARRRAAPFGRRKA